MSNVRDFGASGDGRTDDTDAIEHALEQGDGTLTFPTGIYRISRTIRIPLSERGRTTIDGSGGTAKVVMAAAGPAFHLLGTHDRTADPGQFKPEIWRLERMPTVRDIEIEGAHRNASGLLVEGTMQSTFSGILLRELWDGIRIHGRVRNVIISHCHIYHNRNVGVFLDRTNLHQAIISASHISYNATAGIKIVGSEVRNLQITGNDIEYNYADTGSGAADILIDCSDAGSSVREVTIVSNTIQARVSSGGANVRIVGLDPKKNHKAGLLTISGNLIGSQETNVHLHACRGVVVTGNVIYSGHQANLSIDDSRSIVVGPNSFDHNPDYGDKELCTGINIARSRDVQMTGSSLIACQSGHNTVSGAKQIERQGLVNIVESERVGLSGMQLLDGAPYGLYVDKCRDVLVSGCTIHDSHEKKSMISAVRWSGAGAGNLISGCRLGAGRRAVTIIDSDSDVHEVGNLASGNEIE